MQSLLKMTLPISTYTKCVLKSAPKCHDSRSEETAAVLSTDIRFAGTARSLGGRALRAGRHSFLRDHRGPCLQLFPLLMHSRPLFILC